MKRSLASQTSSVVVFECEDLVDNGVARALRPKLHMRSVRVAMFSHECGSAHTPRRMCKAQGMYRSALPFMTIVFALEKWLH